MANTPVTRVAVAEDESFLTKHDHHIRQDVLGRLIRAGQILVVEDEEILAGWLRWNLFWDEIPFMNMLFVLEHHRGRVLGGALMEAWESTVKKKGYTVVMTSSQSDEKAQHLYRKCGYVDCGVLLLPDQAAEVVFRKELDDRVAAE